MEEIMYKLDQLDDNMIVSVRISFLLKVADIINFALMSDLKLENIVLTRYDRVKLLQSLNRDYIEMYVGDLKYLMLKMKDFEFDKRMIFVTDRAKAKRK